MNALTGKVLYSDNADALRHPASLTKKMTLFLVFEALKSKRLRMNTLIRVSPKASQQPPTKLGIPAGHSVSVETVIKALIAKSSNDLCVAIAEAIGGSEAQFIRLMNQKARQLGMFRTIFMNTTGLPNPNQWSTARDMLILAQALYNNFPEYWPYFGLKNIIHKGRSLCTHNKLLLSYPEADGIKTGFTNASGYNLSTTAVRYTRAGNPVRLFAIIMGASSGPDRTQRAKKLLNIGFQREGATFVNPPPSSSASYAGAIQPISMKISTQVAAQAPAQEINLANEALQKASTDDEATAILNGERAEVTGITPLPSRATTSGTTTAFLVPDNAQAITKKPSTSTNGKKSKGRKTKKSSKKTKPTTKKNKPVTNKKTKKASKAKQPKNRSVVRQGSKRKNI